MKPLDFAVIGAQKCATSWLYYCLREHPHILVPERKVEAHYYGGPEFRERGGEAWFETLFPPDPGGCRRGSVSVDYVQDPAAVRTLVEQFPAIRLILCLREPLQRTVSAYAFLVRRGLLPMRPLSELLGDALDRWPASDDTVTELVTRSLYGRQLEPLGTALDSLMVVSYDAVNRDPAACLRQVYDYIGVDATFHPRSLTRRPKRNANRPWLTRIERLKPDSWLLAKLMDYSNRLLSLRRDEVPGAALDRAVLGRFQRLLAQDAGTAAQALGQIPPERRIGGAELTGVWGRAAEG